MTYKRWDGTDLTPYMGKGLGQDCDETVCVLEAIFLPCNAEQEYGRGHWHGGIHRLDDGIGFHFCGDHGLDHLNENARIASIHRVS